MLQCCSKISCRPQLCIPPHHTTPHHTTPHHTTPHHTTPHHTTPHHTTPHHTTPYHTTPHHTTPHHTTPHPAYSPALLMGWVPRAKPWTTGPAHCLSGGVLTVSGLCVHQRQAPSPGIPRPRSTGGLGLGNRSATRREADRNGLSSAPPTYTTGTPCPPVAAPRANSPPSSPARTPVPPPHPYAAAGGG